jgi:adenosylcobinamide kinase / adenosylcobinamide-phosphate guanylyltransferase
MAITRRRVGYLLGLTGVLVFKFKVVVRELLIGGQKSGKSAQAERLAQCWLAASETHTVVMIATARGLDVEMQSRIARHQADRKLRFGDQNQRFLTIEEPLDLARCVAQHSTRTALVVVDCLTLWLTNWLMSEQASVESSSSLAYAEQEKALLSVLKTSKGQVFLVSNEIGLGVIPMGAQVRQFVDALGLLNQRVASVCDTVTLMTAGLPLQLKGGL